MQLSETIVEQTVRRLLSGGILSEEQGRLKSNVEFMHLARQSHLVASLHQQWRLKVASDVGHQSSVKAVHFSGLMSIDKVCAEKIRELLTNSIAGIKPLVAEAPSKEVFFLGVDFYEPV